MCRAHVTPAAAQTLTDVLTAIAATLAAQSGVDPSTVRIGPVDFGQPISDDKPAYLSAGGELYEYRPL